MLSEEGQKALTKLFIDGLNSDEDNREDFIVPLDYDDYVDFICTHIKPFVPGYDKFFAAFNNENGINEDDEENIIIPFEELFTQTVSDVFRQFKKNIAKILSAS